MKGPHFIQEYFAIYNRKTGLYFVPGGEHWMPEVQPRDCYALEENVENRLALLEKEGMKSLELHHFIFARVGPVVIRRDAVLSVRPVSRTGPHRLRTTADYAQRRPEKAREGLSRMTGIPILDLTPVTRDPLVEFGLRAGYVWERMHK